MQELIEIQFVSGKCTACADGAGSNGLWPSCLSECIRFDMLCKLYIVA